MAAVSSRRESNLMSKGPDSLNESPREGSLSTLLLTPKSAMIASTPDTSASFSTASISLKFARKSRTFPESEKRCRAILRFPSSTSIPISNPVGPILGRINAACPPRPIVASTTIAPDSTARCSTTSTGRTGSCSLYVSIAQLPDGISIPFGDLYPSWGSGPQS